LTVDDIPYHPTKEADKESPASRLTLHHFVDSTELGVIIPRFAPHNFDARQPQDISEWPPAVIVDLFYAMAALNAWAPKSFIKYIRTLSRDTYYDDMPVDNGQDNGNVDGDVDHDVQMGDQTTGQSASGYDRICKTSTGQPQVKERCFADSDLIDGMSALWMKSSRVGKIKQEDVRASDLARNEGVKMWLRRSMEDSTA
jgi:hypothetical protein